MKEIRGSEVEEKQVQHIYVKSLEGKKKF